MSEKLIDAFIYITFTISACGIIGCIIWVAVS